MATVAFASKLQEDGSLTILREAVEKLRLHPGDVGRIADATTFVEDGERQLANVSCPDRSGSRANADSHGSVKTEMEVLPMAQQHIHEGTSQEVTAFLAQRPQNHRFRVIDLSEDEEPSPTPNEAKPTISAKAAAAIAFLDARIAEGIAADPETRRKAEEELEEFKRNMNANRAATGERLVFP